jgi:hypothetical protein
VILIGWLHPAHLVPSGMACGMKPPQAIEELSTALDWHNRMDAAV